MDSVKYIDELREVGQAVAQKVTITDFDGFLSWSKKVWLCICASAGTIYSVSRRRPS